MQKASGRRKPGEHQVMGETRVAIICFLFDQEEGSASESDIRDYLRAEYNIIEPKGIRTQLSKLEDAGFVEKESRQGLSTCWSLRPTHELLAWCHRTLEPERFIRIYRSPIGSRIAADQYRPLTRRDTGVPASDEVKQLMAGLNAWALSAMQTSPSVWEWYTLGGSDAVIAIKLLIAEFSLSAERSSYAAESISRSEARYHYEIGYAERLSEVHLACMAFDAVKYTEAVAADIRTLLADPVLEEVFAPALLVRLRGMVTVAMREHALMQALLPPAEPTSRAPSAERV